MRPLGDTSTMTRKITPISVWKPRSDEADVLRVVVDEHEDERSEPGALDRYSPPMTAITSTSIVAPRPIVDGAICAFHQTKRTPPSAAMKPMRR